jgi:hypothetical protein
LASIPVNLRLETILFVPGGGINHLAGASTSNLDNVPLATGSTRFWDAVQDKQIVTNGSADPGNHYINIKLLYWFGHILSFLAISVLIS